MNEARRFNLAEQIPKIEEKLGIPSGFFNRLTDEGDWAFVIKMHALIEAAVSELLTLRLQNESLKDTFTFMELSNKRTGKMAFITALELLGEPERRFISSLSEMRNRLVHNVKNVTFQLHEEVKKMDKQQFKQFIFKFNTLSTDPDDNVTNLFREDPIQALWYSGMAVLGLIDLKLAGQIR